MICLRIKITTSDPRRFDYNELHPNIRKVNTEKHFRNCWLYHKKEDKNRLTNINLEDTSKEEKHKYLKEEIMKCNTWAEVLHHEEIGIEVKQNINWARDMFATRPVVKGKQKNPPKTHINENNLQDYQKEVLEILSKPPNSREIIWIWSEEVATEKTQFLKYIQSLYSSIPLKLDKDIGINDFINLYNGQEIIAIELSKEISSTIEFGIKQRRDEETGELIKDKWYCSNKLTSKLMDTLEDLSDKKMLSSFKYQGSIKTIESRIVVISNCPPTNVEKRLKKRLVPIQATLRE